ncbi:acyl carrier protein [Streptomyces sp. TBY4]|uniref:acyl carrier protein n=1 Tax=Streptomyces sp. TBY4 TaxID=2962030 RepID=UPI0020B64010|nr:acyl carrier protein [Streptomyces sp. TBY4]MCP3759034.1 acyl carrier protein [Streptomyces sp. TBY4]
MSDTSTTTEMTLDDLRRILSESAGCEDSQLDGDILDTGFAELGYDSLALLETAAVIQRDYGVEIPAQFATPRELLDSVNGALPTAG